MDLLAHRAWLGPVSFLLCASGTLLARALPAREGQQPAPQLLTLEPVDALASEPAPSADRATLAPAREHSSASGAGFAGVELLTAEALPSRQPRGIPGGSLSWTQHGLQWPYLPARSGHALARLGLSGLVWVDSSYRALQDGSEALERAEWEQQTRLLLRATPTGSAPGGWFVQARAELVLLGARSAAREERLGVDDLYVRAGKWRAFDLTAGRFQGWEVYHLGMGLEQDTTERRGASTAQHVALDVGTDLQFLWERQAGPGNLALHLYPLEFLRFELLASLGGNAAQRNVLGVRPAGILDFGVFKAKVAADYVSESAREPLAELGARTLRRGIVGSVQVVVEPLIEAGVAGGYALVDDHDGMGMFDATGSNSTYSFGAFANVRVMDGVVFGAGGAHTRRRNLEVNATGTPSHIETHSQLFGAAQYTLWEQLHIKLVFAHARALFAPQGAPPPGELGSRSLSGRLRLAYAF